MRLRADLILLLVAVLWGSAFAAQRVAGLLGSVYVFNATRFLLAAAVLIPFVRKARATPAQLAWMGAAGTVLFVGSALQQAGLKTTTAGNAGFLTSLYVVLVPLVLWVGWGERPRPLSVAAVLLAASGAFLLSNAGRLRVGLGDALELGGAIFWAIHVVLLGKFASRYDAVTFSAGQLVVASALNWLVSAFLEPPALPISPMLAYAVLYTAIVSLGLGYTLQIWGQRHTPPTDAAIILSLESVFAAIGGAVLLEEWLRPIQLLGCTIIVLAVVLSQLGASGRMRSSGSVDHAGTGNGAR